MGLRTLAFVLIIAATSLYLLERLEPVLRPLLIAVLLTYLFLPVYTRLRRYMRPIFSFLIIAVGITLGLQGLARMVYRDVVLINLNLPRYLLREAELENQVRRIAKSLLPRLQQSRSTEAGAESEYSLTTELSQRIVRGAASAFMTVFLESIVVAFYMIFLLQSASRLAESDSEPASRRSEPWGSSKITQSINRAISEYLVVKVKASLLVGIPVGLACWALRDHRRGNLGHDHLLRQLPSLHRGSGGDRSSPGAGVPRVPHARAADLFALILLSHSRGHGQLDRADDDRQGAGAEPLDRADRAGILEPALGLRGDGPRRAHDGDLQDRARAYPGNPPAGPPDLRGRVKCLANAIGLLVSRLACAGGRRAKPPVSKSSLEVVRFCLLVLTLAGARSTTTCGLKGLPKSAPCFRPRQSLRDARIFGV